MRGRDRLRSVADRRLARVARDWLPPAAEVQPSVEAALMRVGPWRRPALRGLVALVAVAALVAGYGAWHARPRAVAAPPVVVTPGVPVGSAPSELVPSDQQIDLPPSEPAASDAGYLSAPPTPVASVPAPPTSVVPTPVPEVVVHVAGLVARPGVVRLPLGSRVADAVQAAGGVTRRRAADSVNLARVLVDGEQIVVTAAARGPSAPAGSSSTGSATSGTAPPPGVPFVVDLNSAGPEALDTLPGIGPVLASRIVAWRQANGSFRAIDELGEVTGIGEAILEQVRPLVRV